MRKRSPSKYDGTVSSPDYKPMAGTRELGLRDCPITANDVRLLGFAAKGFTNKHIAKQLRIGRQTVDNYFYYLYKKIGADNRAHAVALAMQRGIIQ